MLHQMLHQRLLQHMQHDAACCKCCKWWLLKGCSIWALDRAILQKTANCILDNLIVHVSCLPRAHRAMLRSCGGVDWTRRASRPASLCRATGASPAAPSRIGQPISN